jgi:hypothetical protein
MFLADSVKDSFDRDGDIYFSAIRTRCLHTTQFLAAKRKWGYTNFLG